MRLSLALLLIPAALAAGCTTMTPEEQRIADEEKCRSYGFTRKNDAFAECLQRLELDRRVERRANAATFHDSWIYAPPPVIIVRNRNE
ncbi:hypothetical protein [Nitratireductor sp. ZSWI3]|uniref:hypothetical protein n=1 Tax=Nitratireductor sp. ZSWI3 TaxID=2966359 RepID=UPI00214FD1F5|nr:hypothetical protein [Nitratireductor sp. ZSWI3]MCR4265979.1 hypothetical protein [Nitratireductor sp. ZSWI3]